MGCATPGVRFDRIPRGGGNTGAMSEVVPSGTGQTRVSTSLWGRRTRKAVLLLASWGITELHRNALAEEQQVSRFSYVENLAIRILGFETVASHGPPASEA